MSSRVTAPERGARVRCKVKTPFPSQRVCLVWLSLATMLLCGGCDVLLMRKLMKHHPAFVDAPTVAQTSDGAPGDALNIALIGMEEELVKAMLAAGWFPADAITLASSARISVDTVFHRSYDDAPVSNLFVWARKQDLAFEQPVGPDPKKRHHVRFWRSERTDSAGRPLWLGAATYDASVGLSHRTGQITHHISPDIDAERDKIIADLRAAGRLAGAEWVAGFQPNATGRNGGGDLWRTDQRLAIGVLTAAE